MSEPKQNTAHPEDVDVPDAEMSLYASVISDGDNVSTLKPSIEKKKQLKLSDDSAMAAYINDISLLGSQQSNEESL